MAEGKNVFVSFRKVVQDLLVPELKAVKVSVNSLHTEMKMANKAIRAEMKLNNEALREEIQHGDERNERVSQTLAERFDGSVQIRERLATLEARMPKQ